MRRFRPFTLPGRSARLLNVHHLMRSGDAIPQVKLDTSVMGRDAGAEPHLAGWSPSATIRGR